MTAPEPSSVCDAPSKPRFEWPPRRAGPPLPPPVPPEPKGLRRKLGQLALAWREVERVMLGIRERSFLDRAAETGWMPDGPGVACWRCGSNIGPHESDADGCAACRASKLPWDRFVRAGPYEGILRDGIHRLKFGGWRLIGAQMGTVLGHQIARELEGRGLGDAPVTIVPVPISRLRRMTRGVDHTLVLARAAASVLDAQVVPVIARRHRRPQVGLPPSKRASNVVGSMRVRPRRSLSPDCRVVIVLDDVRTTGATMTAACKCVRKALQQGDPHDAEIWAAVVAVTPERSRRAAATGPKPPSDASFTDSESLGAVRRPIAGRHDRPGRPDRGGRA